MWGTRRAASLALAIAAGIAVAPAATATTPPDASLAGQVSITVTSSSVFTVHLARPVTVPAGGMQATLTADIPWAALVLARQSTTGSVAAPYFTGIASLPDGRAHMPTAFYGSAPRADGTFLLPAGRYALYALVAPGHRLTARLNLGGASQSTVSLWSRRAVAASAVTNQALAAVSGLSDRRPFTVTAPSAIAVLGITSGTPAFHDLAACLLTGPVPPGAEDTCGTSLLSPIAQSSSQGYGAGAIAAVVPQLAKGSYTTVLRGQSFGLGSGLGITTLRWTWTAPATTAVL